MVARNSADGDWAFVVRDAWCKDAGMEYLFRVAGFKSAGREVLEVVADCIMSAGKMVTQKELKLYSGTTQSTRVNVPFEHFSIATTLALNPNVTTGILSSLIEYYTSKAGLINEDGLQFLKTRLLDVLELEKAGPEKGIEASKPRVLA